MRHVARAWLCRLSNRVAVTQCASDSDTQGPNLSQILASVDAAIDCVFFFSLAILYSLIQDRTEQL